MEVALALGAGRANEDGCDGGIRWRYGEPMAFHRTCWEQLLANRHLQLEQCRLWLSF